LLRSSLSSFFLEENCRHPHTMEDIFDYYEVLEITSPQDANAESIQSSYRRLALKYHPDKNPNNPQAILMFERIKKAKEVLIDAKARSAYDAVLRAKQAQKKRHHEMDGKRKQMKEDLLRREEQYKKAKQEEEAALRKYKAEVERVRQNKREKKQRKENEKKRTPNDDGEEDSGISLNDLKTYPSAVRSKSASSVFSTTSVTPAGSHEELEEMVMRKLREAGMKQRQQLQQQQQQPFQPQMFPQQFIPQSQAFPSQSNVHPYPQQFIIS